MPDAAASEFARFGLEPSAAAVAAEAAAAEGLGLVKMTL